MIINDDDYSNDDDGCTADASAADDVYKKDTITITRLTFLLQLSLSLTYYIHACS
jgi:hypothetical protein